MNIEQILTANKRDLSSEVVYFDGAIGQDDEEYFRIYLNPKTKSNFFRVKKEYIEGDIHEYSVDEIKRAGFAPRLGFTPNNELKMFQIPIKHGVKIEYVTIREAEVGVRYPGEAVDDLNNKKKKGCSCQSGSEAKRGANDEASLRGLCKFMSPCASGCCMYKFGSCECVPENYCGPNCDWA